LLIHRIAYTFYSDIDLFIRSLKFYLHFPMACAHVGAGCRMVAWIRDSSNQGALAQLEVMHVVSSGLAHLSVARTLLI